MLMTLLLATVLQSGGHPVTAADHVATSQPGGPVWASFSNDGTLVFQGQGASVAELDAQCLKDCEAGTGACATCVANPLRTELDVSVQAVVEDSARQRLYVAGGDHGLWMIDLAMTNPDGSHPATLIEVDTSSPTARWCFDVELAPNGRRIAAVFGAENNSDLRVYDPDQNPVRRERIVRLNDFVQSIDEGTAYALSLYRVSSSRTDAYVAMGDGGLVRVADVLGSGSTAVQGPICVSCPVPQANYARIRDVVVVNGNGSDDFLYAAGDGYGLIELSVGAGAIWDTTTPFAYGQPYDPGNSTPPACGTNATTCAPTTNNYGVRIDALYDTASGRNVVALATYPEPVVHRDWGPFTSYTGFAWDSSNPSVSAALPTSERGCDVRLFLYDRDPANWNASNPSLPSALGPFGDQTIWTRGWNNVDLHRAVDGTFWVLNRNLEMEHFGRIAGSLTHLCTAETADAYDQRDGSFADGLLSLNDPNYIFFGRDGDPCPFGLPKTVVHPNGSVTIEEALPPSEEHAISLLANGQWLDPALSMVEWYLGGGVLPGACSAPTAGEGRWFVYRFDLSTQSWKRAWVPYPVDPDFNPSLTGSCKWISPSGRGYNFTANDERAGSDLVALARSACINGVVLHSRAELMALTNAAGDGDRIHPTRQLHKRTRTGLDSSTCYEPEIRFARNMGMKFFDVWNGTGTVRALGTAAGWETRAASPNYENPMLSFYDVTNHLTVADCADPVTGLPSDPAVVYGPPSGPIGGHPGNLGGFCFDFDTAIVGDKTFLFAADIGGQLQLFDITDLFGAGALYLGNWQTGPNLLDGVPDGVVFVEFVSDVDPQDPDLRGWLYVSASRLGLVRLRFEVDSSGVASMLRDEVLNTPGQAGGFQIRDVAGKTRVILGDHEDYGLRAYGDF